MKISRQRRLKLGLMSLICLFILNVSITIISAKEDTQKQVVKVGWFEKSSVFLLNQDGMKIGYGYDYLQELSRFGGWDYEYVPVTSENCLQMLDEGKVDILGPVTDDPRVAKEYGFMKEGIFEDYAVLATNQMDRYFMDDFQSFDSMRIGAIKSDLKIQYLQEYAKKNKFDFELILFDTVDEMTKALSSDKIDAKLSSYAALNEKDVIISKFNPFDFKFIFNKKNTTLLNDFNQAFSDIERLNPSFQSDMERKYFQSYKCSIMALTKEESAYLKENPTISITLASLRKPIMSKEGDDYKGICIDILREVEKKLGIKFEFVEIDNQLNAVKEVQSHKADLVSNVYADFGWAENNNLYLSVPYFDMDYAAITKENSHVGSSKARIAAVKGYLFSTYYIKSNYTDDQIVWYNSEQECVDAVVSGDVDICFTNTYVANTYIQDINYKGLHSSLVNFSHGVSLAASKETTDSRVLMSILDKAIASVSKADVYRCIADNTMFVEYYDLSIKEMIERSPMTFLMIFGVFLLVGASLTIGIVIMRNNRIKKMEIHKAKLESQRDSITGLFNRACLELMMSEYLEKESHGAFIMIDLDNFKAINDTNGHDYGDQFLVYFSNELKKEFNQGELLSRMGGDEFSIYVPYHINKNLLIEKIERFQKTCAHSNETFIAYCSIGICFITASNNSFDKCYKEADIALYEAKNNGKNQFCIYEEKDEV